MEIEGTDYELTAGKVELETAFGRKAADAVLPGMFEKNVVAYHTNQAFRDFVNCEVAKELDPNPTLMLVSFGGPGAVQSVLDAAKATNLIAVPRAAAEKSWKTKVLEALTGAMHDYASTWWTENHGQLAADCDIPEEHRADTLEDFLLNYPGKGNVSRRVNRREFEGEMYSVTLGYKMNKSSGKRGRPAKTADNGEEATA